MPSREPRHSPRYPLFMGGPTSSTRAHGTTLVPHMGLEVDTDRRHRLTQPCPTPVFSGNMVVGFEYGCLCGKERARMGQLGPMSTLCVDHQDGLGWLI